MAYVLWKRNGKRVNHPFVYTEIEAKRIAEKENVVFLNVVTRRLKKFGGNPHIKKMRFGKRRSKSGKLYYAYPR